MQMRKMQHHVAAFMLLAAVMGALQWNWFAMPLERDEGEYAHAAWLMRTGKGVPYRDSFLQKPPMIVYTYGLAEAIAPKSDKVGFRVAGFLASLATAGLVWGVGKREFGERAGLLGAWLWVGFAQQLMFSPVAANVEKFMVVPMLGAMAVAGRGERRGVRWVVAGVLAGMAVLYKPICAPVLGVWFLWAVFAKQRPGNIPSESPGAAGIRPVGSAWMKLGWLLAGGAAAVAAGVAWFAWKGAVGEMWECAVAYTGEYAQLTGHPLRRGLAFLAVPGHWKAWGILGLAATGFALQGRRGWGWGAIFTVAWGVAMADVNGHYYLMALPLAAVGAGSALEGASRRWGIGAGWVAMAVVGAALASGDEGLAARVGPQALAAGLYRGNPFVEAEEAGRMVAELCGEDETVHVVGSEPEILWYARRKGATRFAIAYPMTLPTGRAMGYQAEAMKALEREMPMVVVVATTPLGGIGAPELQRSYLAKMERVVEEGKFQLERAFVPGVGWVEGGDWGERLASGATLGVFAKREDRR
jgi:hypothetical protein